MNRSKIIGAVEIGTSKVVVLVGESAGRGRLRIVGKGECPSQGVTKGEITDFKAASNAVHAAILKAEEQAGKRIQEVYLAQTGSHIDSFYHEGTVNVISPDSIVSAEDVARVQAEARSKALPDDRRYIHYIRNSFRLDGRAVGNPIGMSGDKLQFGYWCVTGNERKLRDYLGIINSFDLPVNDVILSSLASGVMVTTPEEKQNGILVVDIGSGTTDYVVYYQGYVACCGTVPVGGAHVTNDLSIGLRVNHKHAEKLKVECGRAFPEKNDGDERVWSVGDRMIGDRHIPLSAVNKIVHARMQELFKILHKRVSDQIDPRLLTTGAVLTGGGSRMNGLTQLAADELGMVVHTGQHPEWIGPELSGAEYSTVLGLFYYAHTDNERDDVSDTPAGRSIFDKVRGLIKL